MLRAIICLPFAACAFPQDDSSTLGVSLAGDRLVVQLQRGPKHEFAQLAGSLDGMPFPANSVQLASGGATFTVPRAGITGADARIEIDEGTEVFVADFPNLFAERTVHAIADSWLEAGAEVDVDDGVAGDVLTATATATRGTQTCLVSTMQMITPGTAIVSFPEDLAAAWRCDGGSGSILDGTLVVTVSAAVAPGRCEGLELTCTPATTPAIAAWLPVTIEL